MTLSTKTTRTVKNDRGAFMREKTKKRRPDEYSFQRNIHGYLLIAPAIFAILLLSVYPLLQGIWISLLNYDMTKANAPNFGDIRRTQELSRCVCKFQVSQCGDELSCVDTCEHRDPACTCDGSSADSQ